MNVRENKIRQLVAELEVHIADAEADLAALKALLASDEVPEEQEDPG